MTDQLEYRWVDDDATLHEVIDDVLAEERYAIDTEFHRERTYFPALALVQLGWGDDRIALIDPLAVDVSAFRRLFESDVTAVFHAAQQDLDVLTHAVGAVPRHFFDTQIAGGFVGYGTPSLSALLNGELSINPPKGDRLTDWLRRPLTTAQRQYAAVDVAHLLDVHDRLLAQLDELGRVSWAEEACRELAQRPVGATDPMAAWTKLKDVKGLRPKPRAVAQAVAAWRERTAVERNTPVRQVLPDLAVLGIAQRQPSSAKELGQARGVDDRFTRGKIAEQLLQAVAEGKQAEPPEQLRGGDDLDRDLRPAVTLISAWVSQVAKRERIDTAMLATRADLTAFLAGDPEARPLTGGATSCWATASVASSTARPPSRSTGATDSAWSISTTDPGARPASGPDQSAHLAPQAVEHGRGVGSGCRTMHRPTGADRLVDDDALGDRGRPDRPAGHDPGEFVDATLGLARHGRYAVEDHARQFEIGVVGVPHSSITSATPPMPRSPSEDGSTTISACPAATSADLVRSPSDGGQSISTAS
ncbi:MAG: HRDC domain-containing protein [Ilumatobacteraceae bacterium]